MAIRTTGVRYDLSARDRASRTFDHVAGRASTLERGLGRLAKSATLAGGALAGGLAVGLAESAKQAVEFQTEMKRIQTQAGGTAKDVSVLSKQVLQLGKTTQQGPQALAQSLYHLKSVGMDNVDAMKALKTSSDLAALGGADLEATTNALAGAWRSGIKGATDFTQAASTVNAIIGAGNMRMEDFVSAIGTGVLPSAKSFGLSLTQVGSALALMTDEGVDAASAATRLRMSFSLLGAPSGKAEDELKAIKLTGTDLATAMRGPQGLIGAIGLLKQHLDASGLSAVKQSQLLSRAFGGGRSSSAILTLVNNFDVLRKKQDQINGSVSKYGPAVAAQRKTVAAQLGILKSNIDVFAIEVGTKLLPPITSFVTYLNKSAIPEVGRFSTALVNLVPVAQMKSGFTTATGFISDFFSGLNPKKKPEITLPTPTIKAPATVIPNNLRRPDLIVPSPTVRVATTRIPSTVKAPAAVKSQAQQLGEQLRGLISGGIGDAIGHIDWGKLGKQIGHGLGVALEWVTTHTADLVKKLEKALGGIDWVDVGKTVGGQSLGFAIGFITSFGMDLFSPHFWEKHWWDTVIAALSFIGVGKVAGPIAKVLERVPILKAFAPLLRGVGRLSKPLGDAAGKVTKFFGSSLWKGLARVFPEGTATLERESGLFTTRVGVWGLRLVEAGRKAVRGLGNGIRIGFEWVIAKIGEGIGWMLKPFVAAGGWLIRRGGEFVGGLRSGIARGAVRLGGWVSDHVISPAVRPFTSAGSWLYGRGSAIVSGLKSGVSDGASRIGGWMGSHVVNPVTGAFTRAGSWLSSAGSNLISGLKNGIVDGMKGMGSWLKSNLVDPIVSAVKSWFGIHSPSKVFQSIGGHLVSGLVKGLATSNGLDIARTVFGDLPSALAAIVGKGLVHIEQLPRKALNALTGLGSKGLNLLGSAANAVFGGGHNDLVGQWATDVRTVLAMLGAPVDALAPVLTRIRMESGGNPNAINLWDSNAKAGHPSQGLMQTIPSTFDAYAGPLRSRGILDPLANIYAGVNYAMHRYGSNWISVMTRPGGYASGGLAPFGQTAWVGERGPELMQVTSRGTRIYSNKDSM